MCRKKRCEAQSMNCFQRFVCAQCESARTACILSSTCLYLPVAQRGKKAPLCSVRAADFLTLRQEYALRQRQAARLLCAERRSTECGRLFLLYIGCRFCFISDIQRRVQIPFWHYFDGRFSRFCREQTRRNKRCLRTQFLLSRYAKFLLIGVTMAQNTLSQNTMTSIIS